MEIAELLSIIEDKRSVAEKHAKELTVNIGGPIVDWYEGQVRAYEEVIALLTENK